MPQYRYSLNGKNYNIASDAPLSNADLSDAISQYETPPTAPKPGKVRTLPAKPNPPMQDVEIANSGGLILSFPASMTEEQMGTAIRNHPTVRQLRAKALGATKNGDPLGDPVITGEKVTTRPLGQGDVKPFHAKDFLPRNFAELGITEKAARTQGVGPAVNAVATKKQQKEKADVDRQIALARERQKHNNDILTPSAVSADTKRAAAVGKINTLNAARAGSLLNRAQPGFDEELSKGTGVRGGLQKLAAGITESIPEMVGFGGVGSALGISKALGKGFAGLMAVNTAETAANTDLLRDDPGQYWTLVLGSAALTAAPFAKQWKDNAVLKGVANGDRTLPPKMAAMLEQKAGLPKGTLVNSPELAQAAAQRVTGRPVTITPAEKPVQTATQPPIAQEQKPVQPAAPKTTQTPPAETEIAPVVPDWLARLKKIVEEAETPEPVPSVGESRLGQNVEGLSSMNSGINPIQVIRDADNLDLPGFTTERPKRDFGVQDTVRSPLTVGEQTGVYERLNPTEGKAVSDAFRNAQRGIESDTHNYGRQVDEVNAFLDRAAQQAAGGSKWRAKKQRPAVDQQFIDLIERNRTDPERIAASSAKTDLGEALRKHDTLTESIRQDIIAERNSRGIPTPEDWGITAEGYYRHTFLGDIVLRDRGGRTVGTANTYAEAQKIALDHLRANPTAELTATARDVRAGDPTVRISGKQYHKTVNQIAGQVNLTHAEIMNDLQGIVGKEANRSKFFGALEHRTGATGYSTNYADVMSSYVHQTARWKGLNALKKTVTPKIEKIRSDGQPGLAEAMESHLDSLWGTPSKVEKQVGNAIREVPILRNHVANPDMAFRVLAQRITRIQSALKLDYNLKSSVVNLLQPLSTLWARVPSKDFAGLYADYMKPATRQMLRDRGVFEAGTKLEGNTPQRQGKFTTPFQAASQVNRGIGYLAGLKEAKAKGLTGDAAHRMGMDYAEMVEFDNSGWNASSVLRSPQGRVLLQFKGFPLKMAETLFGEGGIANRPASVPQGEKVSGVMKTLIGTALPGGVKAVSMGGKLVGGYALVKGLQSALQAQGMSENESLKVAEGIYYGAPSLMDMDLSASVSSFDIYEGGNSLETLTKFLAGPNLSMAGDIVDTAGKLKKVKTLQETREVLGKAAQKITPYAKQVDAAQQMIQQRGQVNVKGRGKQTVPLSKAGGLLRLGGFPPLETSRFWEKK